MKILLRILAGLLLLVVVVVAIGFALPKAHTASVRTMIAAPPESVYAAIADVEHATSWRSGLQKVEVLSRNPMRWRETAEWGTITFVRDEDVPPQRLVARIADESEGFGGT
ncbi:MAG TPA: SRPBCC family protein, partial [Longimicrobiales bacterium]